MRWQREPLSTDKVVGFAFRAPGGPVPVPRYVLTVSCGDRPGLVAELAASVAAAGGNIIEADQHTDVELSVFTQRLEFDHADPDRLDADLDAGPIIAQDVTRVTHRDAPTDMARGGRDLEAATLARAVRLHLEHRVITYANRTVVFD